MNLLPRELPTGRWGQQLDIGVTDGLLEAALTANDGVQAFAAARLAEHSSNQQLLDAELAGERASCVGVRAAAASERYGAIVDHADALLRHWARHALHLARIAGTVLHSLHSDRRAIRAGQLRLGEVVPVSTLLRVPQLHVVPPPAAGSGEDAESAALTATAFQRVSAAIRAAEHRGTPPEVFDQVLPSVGECIAALGLVELAAALHDFGAAALWQVAALTTADGPADCGRCATTAHRGAAGVPHAASDPVVTPPVWRS